MIDFDETVKYKRPFHDHPNKYDNSGNVLVNKNILSTTLKIK